jgi:hypothetical protein
MKRLAVIALFAALTVCTFGQTLEDQRVLIQLTIDLDELQQFYHIDEVEGRSPLIIFNDGVVPPTLELTKFGEEVEFMTTAELFFYNKAAFLDFERFDITPSQADIELNYSVEGLTITLSFEKIEGTWMVRSKQLVER